MVSILTTTYKVTILETSFSFSYTVVPRSTSTLPASKRFTENEPGIVTTTSVVTSGKGRTPQTPHSQSSCQTRTPGVCFELLIKEYLWPQSILSHESVRYSLHRIKRLRITVVTKIPFHVRFENFDLGKHTTLEDYKGFWYFDVTKS